MVEYKKHRQFTEKEFKAFVDTALQKDKKKHIDIFIKIMDSEKTLVELQTEKQIPSTPFLNNYLKRYCDEAKILNPNDFSIRSLRKSMADAKVREVVRQYNIKDKQIINL